MNKKGKITLSVMIISIALASCFSIYFVVAEGEDLTKTYDSETRTVTIKNDTLDVAKIKLETPLVHKVIRGADRLVAEFTIESFDDYSDVFNNIEFYDFNEGMNNFEKDFTYKYKDFYSEEVIDYETICDERIVNVSDVEEYDCYESQTGSHFEERFDWVVFDENDVLPEGNITIGIFTDVSPNEHVEWIPTLFGAEIDEWAEWTESLNEQLISYYKMDVDGNDSLGRMDLSDYAIHYDTGGIIGGHYNFTGAENLTSGTDNLLKFYQNFSVSFWAKTTEGFGGYFFGISKNNAPSSTNDYTARFYKHLTEKIEACITTDTAEYCKQSGSTVNSNQWLFITMVYDGVTLDYYVDGTYFDGVSATDDFSDRWGTGPFIVLGDSIKYDNQYEGGIDEFAIWNRTLTEEEITQLWNNGTGIQYVNTNINYTITFNFTDAITGEKITLSNPNKIYLDMNCDNGLSIIDGVLNPYISNFSSGSHSCNASITGYFQEIINFIADEDKNITVQMSPIKGLSQEEHDWLEAVYNCIIEGTGCAS